MAVVAAKKKTMRTVPLLLCTLLVVPASAWVLPRSSKLPRRRCLPFLRFMANSAGPGSSSAGEEEWKENGSLDSNTWMSSSEDYKSVSDWEETVAKKKDGSFWTAFEPLEEDDDDDDETIADAKKQTAAAEVDRDLAEEVETESWLDTLAALSVEEIEFNRQEATRADMARQMEEWGFTKDMIANALDVATDDTLERMDEVDGMQEYREKSYWDDVDLETVESHTMVEKDKETGEPIRSQMVYVDEHTCIGCTNCATIATSTFFMHSEHGRARVFQQWGDDDETIQIAIETCPVDCIHYIPYEELEYLEKDRRNQNINFKGRLVSQAEFGNSMAHVSGKGYTAPQKISGNMLSRCSNCPSRGCANCPMYGVGKNPEYERKERLRKERLAKRQMQRQREAEQKRVEL